MIPAEANTTAAMMASSTSPAGTVSLGAEPPALPPWWSRVAAAAALQFTPLMMEMSSQTPSGRLLRPTSEGLLRRGLRDGGAAAVPDERPPPGRRHHRVENQGAQV